MAAPSAGELLECAKCAQVLLVVEGVQRFRCPVCDSAYAAEVAEDDAQRRAGSVSVNPPRSPRRASQQRSPRGEQKMAEAYDIPIPAGLDEALFAGVRKAFRARDPGQRGLASCSALSEEVVRCIPKKDQRAVNLLLARSLDAFGPKHELRFSDFIKRLAAFREQNDREQRGAAPRAAKLRRLDTNLVRFENTELAKFKRRNPLLQWLLDLRARLGSSTLLSNPLWRGLVTEMEAHHGPNVAAVFHFMRWLFLLNAAIALLFLFILVPVWSDFDWGALSTHSYRGLVIGEGMLDSFLFYGGLRGRYGDFRMDVSYVFVAGLMLFASLIAVVAFIGNDGARDRSNFRFTAAVFTGCDMRVRSAVRAQQQRRNVQTAFDQLVKFAEDEKRAAQGESPLLWVLRLLSMAAALMLAVVQVLVVVTLVNWEAETLVPDVDSDWKFLVVPLLISLLQYVAGELLVQAVARIERYRIASDAFFHSYVRVFALRAATVLAVVFATFGARSEPTRPCKETQVGQIFLRLLWAEIALELLLSLVLPFIVKRVRAACSCWREPKIAFSSGDLAAYDMAMASPDPAQALAELRRSREDVREFDIPNNLVKITYRQLLIWAGSAFSPVLPLLFMLTSWTIVYAKRLQVLFFTRRPSRPMSVWRQNMYLRNSLVVAMLVALVPFTYLLRQVVSCGPHRLPVSIGGVQYDGTAPNSTLSVIDVVMARVDETPGVVSLTFHLLTNAFVLWLAILALSAYASLLDKAAGAAKDDLRLVKTRLRLELREKMAIIQSYGIVLAEDTMGKDLFKAWVEDELGELGVAYGQALAERGYGDLFKLAKLSREQLRVLLAQVGANDEQVEAMTSKLEAQRVELLRLKAGRL